MDGSCDALRATMPPDRSGMPALLPAVAASVAAAAALLPAAAAAAAIFFTLSAVARRCTDVNWPLMAAESQRETEQRHSR